MQTIPYFDISILPTDCQRFSFTDSVCVCVCVFMFLENDPLVLSSLVREEVSKILHWEAVRRSWGHGLIPEGTSVMLNVDRIM